jgi:L-lysine exporter family protein LysE/ArgO
MHLFLAPAFMAGFVLSLSLIMAIGPQNAHIMRMGLLRQHLWLTVAVCVLTDIVLIAAGVGGLAQLGGLSDKLLGAMTGSGALVLAWYGAQAMRRFLHPAPPQIDQVVQARPSQSSRASEPMQSSGAANMARMSRRRAVGLTLALSWLNPHVWLDTAVVIGSSSLAYAQPDNAVFGLGAATGSLLWFSALGVAMLCLGGRLNSPAIWRALDAVVALMMWGTALWLLAGLL